jgi:hypothetical protein
MSDAATQDCLEASQTEITLQGLDACWVWQLVGLLATDKPNACPFPTIDGCCCHAGLPGSVTV